MIVGRHETSAPFLGGRDLAGTPTLWRSWGGKGNHKVYGVVGIRGFRLKALFYSRERKDDSNFEGRSAGRVLFLKVGPEEGSREKSARETITFYLSIRQVGEVEIKEGGRGRDPGGPVKAQPRSIIERRSSWLHHLNSVVEQGPFIPRRLEGGGGKPSQPDGGPRHKNK